jgi:hypothetical protein
MLVENQVVKVKWNGRNKDNFISKGYVFTKLGDELEINPTHLTKGSDALVKVICDYCDKEKSIIFNQYYNQVFKVNLDKYCCKECSSERVAENYESELRGLRHHKECLSRELEGIVYKINIDVETIDTIQKILINEIIRFCEENNRFPSENDMSNKKGYVSKTQYPRYFNIKNFSEIKDYISPVPEIQPNTRICSSCGIEKILDADNYAHSKVSKFGYKTSCRACENKKITARRFRKLGIIFESYDDITPEKWWEHLYENKVGYLPDFCFTEENILKIIRYVIKEKLKFNKEEICHMNMSLFKEMKIFHLHMHLGFDKLLLLQKCFPEYNFRKIDMNVIRNINDEDKSELIKQWIKEKNFSIEALLNCDFDSKDNKRIVALVASSFNSYVDMICWYFNYNKILHPTRKDCISVLDFRQKPNGFWAIRENRVNAVKTYCDSLGIQSIINDTEKLKKWAYQFFKQFDIVKVINYGEYYDSLYDVLVDAYPEIVENKLLFKWEWHQWNKYDENFLIQLLKDFINYRLKITDYMEIPNFLNYSYMKKNYLKIHKHIDRKRFNSYYDWACKTFPEYSSKWKEEDFRIFRADDGVVLDSSHERDIYHHIKNNLKINIEAIGTDVFNEEHQFILEKGSHQKYYVPDFLVRRMNDKPLYIEYYGMYTEKYKDNKLLNRYREKTKNKNEYYRKLKDIDFIALYPEDMVNNFLGVENKIFSVI